MENYVKKVKRTFLYGLILLAILGIIYLAMPKYQIHSVKVDDNTVVVTKLNTLTGKLVTTVEYSVIKRTESGKKFHFY